jgi:hypothetical protein
MASGRPHMPADAEPELRLRLKGERDSSSAFGVSSRYSSRYSSRLHAARPAAAGMQQWSGPRWQILYRTRYYILRLIMMDRA